EPRSAAAQTAVRGLDRHTGRRGRRRRLAAQRGGLVRNADRQLAPESRARPAREPRRPSHIAAGRASPNGKRTLPRENGSLAYWQTMRRGREGRGAADCASDIVVVTGLTVPNPYRACVPRSNTHYGPCHFIRCQPNPAYHRHV